MKKKVISALTVAVLFLGLVGFTKYNEYVAKEPVVTVELGDKISEKPEDYVRANKKSLENTKLDFSKVDNMKVGEYPVKASCGDRAAEFVIEVQDTVAPKMKLVETESGYKAVVGQTLSSTAIVESVKDKAGMKAVTFSEGQVEASADSENVLERVALKFDEVGVKEVTIKAEDVNGNVTEEKVKIKVVEDYLAHVSGMKDLTVEQGSTIDWMSGVTKDEKVLEVKADASKVDMNTAGEYTLTYVITGDDKETVVKKDVKVTVVTPQKAQEMANTGSDVKTTGGVKKKVVAQPSRRKSTSSGSRSSGSSSKSSGSKKPSSSGSKDYSYKTWEGTVTGSGYIDGPNGNTYEAGTWNPYE